MTQINTICAFNKTLLGYQGKGFVMLRYGNRKPNINNKCSVRLTQWITETTRFVCNISVDVMSYCWRCQVTDVFVLTAPIAEERTLTSNVSNSFKTYGIVVMINYKLWCGSYNRLQPNNNNVNMCTRKSNFGSLFRGKTKFWTWYLWKSNAATLKQFSNYLKHFLIYLV